MVMEDECLHLEIVDVITTTYLGDQTKPKIIQNLSTWLDTRVQRIHSPPKTSMDFAVASQSLYNLETQHSKPIMVNELATKGE